MSPLLLLLPLLLLPVCLAVPAATLTATVGEGDYSIYAIPLPYHTKTDIIENRVSANASNPVAQCRDPDLARYMNTAMGSFIHDMGSLAKNILDQITGFRKPGTWMVHAAIIAGQRQAKDWQSLTNGDIFSGRNPAGCWFHDQQTYILVVRLY